ncbi:MAG: FAD-binding oxidoreductase [bacterium]
MIRSFPPKEDNSGHDLLRISSPDEITSSYNAYLIDESRFGPGWAEEILFPTTESQICKILREMSNNRTPVTISGSRTGITSAAVPIGGVLINLERMNRLLDLIYETEGEWCVWVEPGLRLSEFQAMIESKDIPLPEEKTKKFINDPFTYFYPPDPTEETALIGSTVATNASGARSMHYGATRDFVQALRVALTNGEILEIERGMCKPSPNGLFQIIDSTGREISFAPPGYTTPSGKSACGYFSKPDMDLIDLFIGAEGTLGVITAIKVKLAKKPEAILSALSFFTGEEQAVSFVIEAREKLTPLCLEYFDSNSLNLIRSQSREGLNFCPPDKANAAIFWEAAYLEEELEELYENWEELLAENGSSMDETWAGMEKKDWLKLKEFRHCIPEFINRIIGQRKTKNPKIHKISTDMAVPDHYLRDIMKEYRLTLSKAGLEYIIFGHIGDNHLHVNMIPENESDVSRAKDIYIKLAQKVVSLGGIVAAEHGIGKLKHDLVLIQYGENGINEMARVKKALDPSAILGRGNIFPETLLDK